MEIAKQLTEDQRTVQNETESIAKVREKCICFNKMTNRSEEMKTAICNESGVTDEKNSVANKKEYKIDRLSKERIESYNYVNLIISSKLINKHENFLRNREFVCNISPSRC